MKTTREVVLSILAVALLAVVLLLGWKVYSLGKERDQLSGNLTQKEKAFQEANQALGIAQATLKSSATVDGERKDLQKAGAVPNLDSYLKKSGAGVVSVTTAKGRDTQTNVPGKATVVVQEPHDAGPSTSAALCPTDLSLRPETVITYDWQSSTDGAPDGRFHLYEPDVLHSNPAKTVFSADQRFRLSIVGIRMKGGVLQTQQIAEQEVTATGKVIKDVTLTEVHFDYAPDPPTPLFDPHLYVAPLLATHFAPEVSVGASIGAMLLQWHGFGLQLGGYVASAPILFSGAPSTSWVDVGADVGVFYRPSLAGKPFNLAPVLMFGYGLAGPQLQLGLDFVVW